MPSPDGPTRIDRGVLRRDLVVAATPIGIGRFDPTQGIVVARSTDGDVALLT